MGKKTINRAGVSTGKKLTSSERRWIFGLTFVLVLLSWASIKIVLPALPGLAHILHSTPDRVKLSVSLYLVFYACSQPVWGGIVQKTSCRQTLFYSLFITMAGSLIVMFSFNLSLYIIGRTLQGVGMGAASPVGRTLIVNVFERKELARRMGLVSGSAAAMPAIAPIIGGYLMMWINWRAIFGFMLLLFVIYFYFAFRHLPTTHIESVEEGTLTTTRLLKTYLSILKNTKYWGYTFAYAAVIGGLLGYYSAMPFWYHSQLGIEAHLFSYLTIPTVSMYIIGLVFASFLIKKNDLEAVFILGMLLACFTTIVAIFLAIMKISGLVSIVGIMSLYGFSAGLVAPNANAGVLTTFKKVAAPTAALVSVVVFGTAALTSSVTMNLYIKDTLWPVVIYLGILSSIGFAASYFWIWLPHRGKSSLPGGKSGE